MISVIIYIVLIGLNVLGYIKRTGKGRWFNLGVAVFMVVMGFFIKWNNLP